MLDQINIVDKHRLVKFAGGLIHINTTNLPEGIQILVSGDVDDGDVFALMPAHLNPETDFDPRLSFEVKIDIPRPIGGVGLPKLDSMYEMVADKLLPEFINFFLGKPNITL